MRSQEISRKRERRASPWRTTTFAAALLAVTFNFLQPLIHVVAMRAEVAGMPWSTVCKTAIADADRATEDPDSAPLPATDEHECCLGLASPPFRAAPPTGFVVLPPIQSGRAPALPVEERPAACIRDGPNRSRAPPSFS